MQGTEPDRGTGSGAERVTVVVLNWNGWRDTVACLESLRRLDVLPRVIVVDNGSTDGSPDRIRAEAPWARLLELPANRGFSAGMNAGISAALADGPAPEHVWVLNNDTLVEPSTLSRMVALADSDATIGIVGSRVVDADGSGRVQALGGGAVNLWLGTTTPYVALPASACASLVGASMLLRRSFLHDVGGFDERYFFYLGDTDLSLRARRAGWRLAIAADATVVHRRGGSIDNGSPTRTLRSDVHFARSVAIFVSSLSLPWRITAVPFRYVGMVINRIARRQPDRVIPMTRAYLEGLRIGRRLPRIPIFGAAEGAGSAEPARPWPALVGGPAVAATSEGGQE